MIPQKDHAPPVRRGTGWQTAAELAPPPGIGLMDQMMDQQDLRDRAERILDLAKSAAMERAKAEAAVKEATKGDSTK